MAKENRRPYEKETTIPDGRVWLRRGYPVIENGKLVGLIETVLDITKQKRTENELLQKTAELQAILMGLPDLYMMLDRQMTVIVFHPGIETANSFTRGIADVTGCKPQDFLPAEIAQRFCDAVETVIKTGRLKTLELQLESEGETRTYEARFVPMFSIHGQTVVLVRDITERKQLEEHLIRAQKLELAGRIAGQVAHDFNQLLTPLAWYPEMIKNSLETGHPGIQLCDRITKAAEQMVAINDDLLALGRRGHHTQEPLDINALITSVVVPIRESFYTIDFQLDLEEKLPLVKGSSAQLVRVLSNLISNAREAMNNKGVIRISTHNVYMDRPIGRYTTIDIGEYVRIDVEDNGPGIPAEIINHIFDAFFTTKRTKKDQGSGLGLSVVQAILEDHNGYVDVVSEIGRGSVFSIYLPVCHDALIETHEDVLQGGCERVLVVDDDPVQQDVLRGMLSSLGYQVDTVNSGEEALEYVATKTVDLVILDMIMPGGMDGADTYRMLVKAQPGQRAVIASGFTKTERVKAAQQLGAGPFLRKPVRIELLAKAVRQELDRPNDQPSQTI